MGECQHFCAHHHSWRWAINFNIVNVEVIELSGIATTAEPTMNSCLLGHNDQTHLPSLTCLGA